MSGMLARATRKGSQTQIRHVSPTPYDAAEGPVKVVYAQVERDFGMLAPPVTLHAPEPAALAASWLMLRETLVASGRASRAEKEVVAAAVSLGNTCPYCVEVHGTALHGLVDGHDAAAVAEGRLATITDPRLRAIAAWAGATRPEGDATRPFPREHAAELIGVAVTFHYLNRMANVFLTDSVFPEGTPDALRRGLRRVMGRLLRPSTRSTRAPGEALDLLPGAEPPEDLSWAAGNATVAGAFGRAAAAVDGIGRRSVPAPVRALVEDDPAGERVPAGLDASWVGRALAGVPASDRPAGRLALLTAHASYRVDQAVIDAFRRDRPDDATLIGLTSWAAFTAARAEGRRLHAGLEQVSRR